MKLYGSFTSPFVRKVRVFALERGVAVEMIKEDPWQVSDRLLAMTPLGKVPVLVADDDRIVIDSFAVMDFLDAAGDPAKRFIPLEGAARADALKWHAIAHGIIDATVVRLLETRRPEAFQMKERMLREEQRIAKTLDFVEERIGEIAPPGAEPGFGQLMLGVAMTYMDFRYPHDWKSAHPQLAQRVAAMALRSSFKQTEPPA